jgi:tetratricopeptide (TPR) repeat protein
MYTETQPELLPETESDWINALSGEACRLHDAAVEAHGAGRFDEAEERFRRSITLFEQLEGPVSPDVAVALGNLGAVLEDRCDYLAAEECYVRAATITGAIEEDGFKNYEDDEDVARLRLQSLDNLGGILRMQGHYAQAEPVIRRALNFAERTFGAESLEVSGALNNLGVLGKFAGWFEEAAECYRRALAILENHYGKDCAEAASIYHNMGGLEHAQGRFAEGEPFARKSVELRRRVQGDDHPEVAADMAALAALLDGQSKFDEAERLYNSALEIFTRVYGEEHYEVATTLNNLAMIHQARGDYARTEATLMRALAIKEKIFSRANVDVALTLNNLAVSRGAQGDDEKAAELYDRALAVFEAELGADHPITVICRENYEDLNRGRQIESMDVMAEPFLRGI